MLDVCEREDPYHVFSSNIGDVGDDELMTKLGNSRSNLSITRVKTIHAKKEAFRNVDGKLLYEVALSDICPPGDLLYDVECNVKTFIRLGRKNFELTGKVVVPVLGLIFCSRTLVFIMESDDDADIEFTYSLMFIQREPRTQVGLFSHKFIDGHVVANGYVYTKEQFENIDK